MGIADVNLFLVPPTHDSGSLNHIFSTRFSRGQLWAVLAIPTTLFVALSEKYGLSWSHIVEAVKHEMSPMMSTKIYQVVEELALLRNTDFREEVVDKVVAALKKKCLLTNRQITYICSLVQRAQSKDDANDR